jgi:hypothetical protein
MGKSSTIYFKRFLQDNARISLASTRCKASASHRREGKTALPHTGLEQQIRVGLEADAGLEERLERVALAGERVDDVRAGLDERRLEHVRQEREHRVQLLELARARRADLDAREELSEDGEVEDERGRKKRVLKINFSIAKYMVERGNGRRTSHSLKMLIVERPPQKISE